MFEDIFFVSMSANVSFFNTCLGPPAQDLCHEGPCFVCRTQYAGAKTHRLL